MSLKSGKVEFCIGAFGELLPEVLLERLKTLSASIVSDGMGGFNAMNHAIKPLVELKGIVTGPALTVRLKPADNLLLHKAISLARTGDIIVVDTGGTTNTAVMGELMCLVAIEKKVSGIVIDGLVRDIKELQRLGLPIFARGTTPNAGGKDGPGEINVKISCGGVVVNPGDIIVGDEDGLVVIGRDDVIEVLNRAQKKLNHEVKRKLEIQQGIFITDTLGKKIKKEGLKN